MSAQDRVLQAVIPDVEYAISRFWEGEYGRRCESEIERIFAATMFVGGLTHSRTKLSESRATCVEDGANLFLEPQYVIGNYRVDFLYGFAKSSHDLFKCVVIECDGHDFHERTKEQAARDKARDRFLSTQVGRVVRFTGSELYRDPTMCVMDATKALAAANGFSTP